MTAAAAAAVVVAAVVVFSVVPSLVSGCRFLWNE